MLNRKPRGKNLTYINKFTIKKNSVVQYEKSSTYVMLPRDGIHVGLDYISTEERSKETRVQRRTNCMKSLKK